jgi:hypothetical protein
VCSVYSVVTNSGIGLGSGCLPTKELKVDTKGQTDDVVSSLTLQPRIEQDLDRLFAAQQFDGFGVAGEGKRMGDQRLQF